MRILSARDYAVLRNGEAPAGYHAINLAQHLASITLVYPLGWLVLAEFPADGLPGGVNPYRALPRRTGSSPARDAGTLPAGGGFCGVRSVGGLEALPALAVGAAGGAGAGPIVSRQP